MTATQRNDGTSAMKSTPSPYAIPLPARALGILGKLRPGFQDIVLLFFRLTIGWSFFLTGKGKLANLERTTGFFESLGIPAPGFHAGMVGTVEMLGGLALVAGLASRLAAVPLAISMGVAYLTAHREDAFKSLDAFAEEAPYSFLVVSLVVLAFGPGRLAVDHWIGKFLTRKMLASASEHAHD